MDVVVGIDLGTSNSVISVALEGEPIVIPDAAGNRIHPSIVYFFPDGRTVVGNEATEYLLKDPAHTVFSAKRLIGRPYDAPELKVVMGGFPFKVVPSQDGAPRINIFGALHPPEGISARVLMHLKKLAEDYLGQTVEKAVITVPANFDEGQRRATKRAGELAGFDVLRLVNEPTAAALSYGYGEQRRERVAIYDFGGGTFDITILELRGNVFQVLATAGNSYLGGDDFDNRLVTSMLTAFEKQYGYDLSDEDAIRQRLKAIGQQVKHRLSYEQVVTSSVSEMVPGSLTELELEFSLTQDAFNSRCEDIVDASLNTCEEALKLSGLQLAEIDHLVLVGGTTRIPYVQSRVEEFFNRKAVMDVNPDEVVAIGAAIFGQSLVEAAQAPAPSFSVAADAEHFEDDGWIQELDDEEMTEIHPPMTPPPIGQNPLYATSPGMPGDVENEMTQQFEQFDGGDSTQNVSISDIANQMPQRQTIPAQTPSAPAFQQPNLRPQGRAAAPVPSGPVLIDVTPHALGVATVGGVMDIIIERNGSIPLQRSRQFSTSRDDQTRVVLPVYSGNSRRIEDNRQIGMLELTEIAPGPREETQIEVTFEVDTSGMLSVRATDMRTGKNQVARISLLGESSEDMNFYDSSNLLMT